MAAATAMFALLFPVARGKPIPPDVFAARILRQSVESKAARVAGLLLQLLFGAFWGAALVLITSRTGAVGGSYPAQGALMGLLAFLVSLAGFATLGLIPHPADWRAWTGHFLNHIAFGLMLGSLVLAVGAR